MKKHLLGFAVFGLLSIGAQAALAQEYVRPEFNGCIRQYYDSHMYNWLAFENTCSQSLYIVFIPNSPGYGQSGMDLLPGRHGSTGYSRSEVDSKGGFELYVCPSGYVPVGPDNRYVSRVIPEFRCKRQ